MRTMLRSKISLLFIVVAALIAIPAIALADGLEADADDLVAATPHGNSTTATQQPGTTVEYDFSAQIKDTGNAGNNVFPGTVTVSIARAGDWLASSAGTPSSFDFTAYNSPQAGKIGVTVPCNANTTAGSADSRTMTVGLTAGTSTNGQALNPNSVTLSYTITASGAPAASCTPANHAPTVSTAAEDASGNVGSELTTSGTFSDEDTNDTLTITRLSGAGTVTDNGDGKWSWSHTPNDNGSGTVEVRASDGTAAVTDSFDWSAANVAPTVTNIAASAQNALSDKNVTFTGTATDPSSADTTAGFSWQWSKDGGTYAAGSNPFSTSFSTCGSHSVSAKATDKDGGTSAAVSSDSVNVYNASFAPPVDASPYINTAQKGKVIPVKISVSCNGNIANLSPSIQLLSGDKTDGSETISDEIETYSVSSADTTGVMRAADGGYIYNLRVPDVANAYYTVRVNAFGGSNASSNMYALLKTRK